MGFEIEHPPLAIRKRILNKYYYKAIEVACIDHATERDAGDDAGEQAVLAVHYKAMLSYSRMMQELYEAFNPELWRKRLKQEEKKVHWKKLGFRSKKEYEEWKKYSEDF